MVQIPTQAMIPEGVTDIGVVINVSPRLPVKYLAYMPSLADIIISGTYLAITYGIYAAVCCI